jgi:hypothetical protein
MTTDTTIATLEPTRAVILGELGRDPVIQINVGEKQINVAQ